MMVGLYEFAHRREAMPGDVRPIKSNGSETSRFTSDRFGLSR